MTNESYAQVPLDMKDDDGVQKFLRKTVEEIDRITGARADDPYVSQSELEGATEQLSLTSINTALSALLNTLDTLDKQVEENFNAIEEIQPIVDITQFTVLYVALDATYNDFDNVVWGTLQARGQFSALGSAMTNPPFVVTVGTTYIIYADSALTVGGGVVQTVMMEDTGVDVKVFVRTGDDFAQAVINGWTQL